MEDPFVGTWYIYEMELWDEDYFNMETQALITINADYTGIFHFGLVNCGLDGYIEASLKRLSFTFEGQDELEPVSGSGWLQLESGNEAAGRFVFHRGNSSEFRAKKQG